MTTQDLLIFTLVISTLVIGVTVVGWIFFVRWYKSEESRRHIDAHVAETMKEKDRA